MILGAIMSVLDTTIVNVALDDLSKDLHSSLDDIQWVVTGYLLALAAVIPVTGWAARRFGSRRLYLVALVAFTMGSALCGLAWSTGSLVAFRVLQGVGGGMLVPIGQMVLVRAAGPRNLPRVMSMIGVPIILAPVFGPTLGGLLLEHAGWQWIFLVNVPIGILTVAVALRLLPRDTPEEAGRLDVLGLALVATGLVGLTYGLAQSGTAGSLLAASVLVPALAGVALIAAFVWRALHIEAPLLDVRLYANRAFAAASLTTFALGAALFGAMILMPLYFQTVRGEDAVTTGLLLMPQGIGAAIAMRLSARATERWGGGMTALGGGLVTVVATVPFVLIGAGTSYWLIGAAMVFRGFGIGMSMMPSMTAAFAVLRSDQVTHATPQLTVLQRVGGSMGTAILSVVLQGGIDGAGARPTAAAVAGAFGDTYVWVLGVTAFALVPTLLLTVIERRARLRREAVVLSPPAPAAEAALEAAA
ncbi:DHA2 family efflux MFS transporter permease subunit [Baekduia soli]|uniref:DHA2 family efflux MFS transporter permease subunit n=1 Tax=Baekduia soli TaxID=496014 RepID=UPI00225E22B6|nr:DHA2 family efflux MFS transporter permease subunit [Baekduia soli]